MPIRIHLIYRQATKVLLLRSVALPPSMPLAQDLIDPSGAYLLDSGRLLLLWLGRGVSPAFLTQVLLSLHLYMSLSVAHVRAHCRSR